MVIVKTAELTGPALDWAVAKCEGRTVEIQPAEGPLPAYWEGEGNHTYWYSTEWAHGGPIIEREKIDTEHWKGVWAANMYSEVTSQHTAQSTGATPLIVAMRCYVASKLGDSVEVPSELF